MTGPCKKCGDGPIKGPNYEQSHDLLRYWCSVCGYSFTRPCADAEQPQPTPLAKLVQEQQKR